MRRTMLAVRWLTLSKMHSTVRRRTARTDRVSRIRLLCTNTQPLLPRTQTRSVVARLARRFWRQIAVGDRNSVCPDERRERCPERSERDSTAGERHYERRWMCSRDRSQRAKEKIMSGRIATLIVVGTLLGVGAASAQEASPTPGPGFVEVTYIPAGAAFFTAKDNSPSFGNYGFGTGVTFRVNRYVGLEGELGSMIATTSDLQFGDLDSHTKAPNMLSYTGNVVVSPWVGHSVVPYGTAGVGGMTMFERPELGITSDETFLTGNFGGGVKWYAPNNRWGVRGDYRFGVTRSKDDAPAFFGRDTRYLHRVYGAVIINTAK